MKGHSGVPPRKRGLRLAPLVGVDVVLVLGVPHHGGDVGKEAGRVRVLLRVSEGVVLPVENGVGPGHEERWPLGDEGEEVEEALPTRATW